MRKVINSKKTFSTINEGSVLDGWPSEAIKRAAGKTAWGDWKLADGMIGEVVHSWGDSKHLLKVNDKYVVVGEDALEGDPRKPKKIDMTEKVPKGMRRVVNSKKTFSTINEGSVLDGWPSEAIKRAAGKSAWGDWRLADGMIGEVVQSWGDSKLLLKVDDKYVVVGEDALEGAPPKTKKKKKKEKKKEEPKMDWDESKSLPYAN
jgi:hypothetical protein